jgi:hypothetical protein
VPCKMLKTSIFRKTYSGVKLFELDYKISIF